jgi:prepilin-type N-terminal cleavage/methylation domain-containing protein
MHHRGSTTPAPRAFTLLEAVIVVVIIGILAGAVVPTIINVGRRQAEQEAKEVRALLTVAADKATVMHQPVAIDYVEATTGANGHGPRLSIWVQRESSKAATDATGAARVEWMQDRMSDMVELSRLRISSALQDGGALAGGKWRVPFTPGHPRPSIELRLEPAATNDGPTWTVSLKPDDTAATLGAADATVSPTKPGVTTSQRTIDLDDAGQGDSKW